MRKAILPLLIIITMVLSASAATAADFSATGAVDSANGWSPNGPWVNDIDGGVRVASYTDTLTTVSATHSVDTQPSQRFSYEVQFKVENWNNIVTAGLKSGGHEYAIEYKNSKFYFNGAVIGSKTTNPTSNFIARIWSDDGNVWHGSVSGDGISYEGSATVNNVPTTATIALSNTSKSAVIYNINFVSSGDPVPTATPIPTDNPTPTPVPSEQPAAGGSSSGYDVNQVQDFYSNIYPLIGSPYDTVTYNTDGTYTVTKGYPSSDAHSVSGTVTSAADGSPIAGASVVLDNAMQKTGNDGKFKFNSIGDGVFDLAVSADGFASKTQSVDVNSNLNLNIALEKEGMGGSTIANAENETDVTAGTNVTMADATAEPTEAPTATQTQSPGFEGIVAAIAMIGAAGALVYLNRKH